MTVLGSFLRASFFAKIWGILSASDRRLAVQVLAGMLIGMLFETLSVGAVIPALALFSGPQAADHPAALVGVLERLGNPSQEMLVLGGLLFLLGLYGIKSVVLAAIAWQQARFLATIRRNVSNRLFETYLVQPWTFHLQRNSSQLIHNTTTEIAMFAQGCQGLLAVGVEASVTAGIACLLVWVEPLAACVTGTALALATWSLQAALRDRIKRWGQSRQRAEGQRVKALQQALGGVREVKVCGREQEFLEYYRNAQNRATHATQMQMFSGQLPRLWYELLAVASVVTLGVTLIMQGVPATSLIPRLGLFAVAAFRLMPSMYRLVAGVQSIKFIEPAVDMLVSELALPAARVRAVGDTRLPFKDEIRLEGVTFSYPHAAQPAIRNVSFVIHCGSAVGIIGESGAGKSTLIDLLLGLLAPDSGSITVDGQDIHHALREWQNSIGYVPQTIFLTDDSIRANVAFGVPDDCIDDEAVCRALKAAQLDEFVSALPDGIHTIVGERGVRLSGGQRQRIGIARALYWDPPILMLDEATSALDTATESGVMDAVNRLHGVKTLIIIAHRMTTVSRCDEVVRLSRGELVGLERLTSL